MNHRIDQGVLPSKITAPELGSVFERPSLLHKLGDLAATVRKVWVSSPGGAGKTTLVRSLVASDARPLVWYNVDVEDRDPANLFYYLARTAPEGLPDGSPLPHLTSEYLPSFAVFCRNFFRTYFARFAAGCVVVFDDLQEGPGEAFLGPVLLAAMAELPFNSALFLLSREEPYTALARDRVHRTLAHVNWGDLRLSSEETRRFLSWSLHEEPSTDELDRAVGVTQGWLAGLLLFLENPAATPLAQQSSTERTELLFDYFAGEIFPRLRTDTQAFLLTCALLPTMEAGAAERLTGRQDAGEILRAMTRGNHFIFRISATREIYRFHPLFRHFLLTRAAREWDLHRMAERRQQAARLLMAEGQVEAGADLLIAAEDWCGLSALIATQAEALLKQGRMRTLLIWLKSLPEELRRADPWSCYWMGCCLNAEDPAKAREALARAFALFEAADDATGCMLACAMGIYAVVVGWNEHTELDVWIARFYRLRERHPEYPSSEIEALMVQAICEALVWRQPSHPDLPAWAARLRQLVIGSGNSTFRIVAGADLNLYYMFMGDVTAARALDEMRDELRSDGPSPLQKIIWCATRAFYGIISLDCQDYLASFEAARTLVGESGVHVADMRLFVTGAAAAMSAGDLALARRLFDEVQRVPETPLLDQAYYLHAASLLAGLDGDAPQAIATAEMAVIKSEAVGAPVAFAFGCASLVLALHQGGQWRRAKETLDLARAAVRGMHFFECYFAFLAAFFALKEGEIAAAHCLLRESLGFAARHRLNLYPWNNDIMARLCGEAMDAGIEIDYVQRLAAHHKLDLAAASVPRLTPREIEILTLMCAGKTNGDIAQLLGATERTAKFHVGNILQKLGANTRAHAVALAMQRGLVPKD